MSGKSFDPIRIPNLGKIQRNLKDLGASRQEMQNASFEAGIITARSIQAFIPVKTGKLKSTVKAARLQSKVVVSVGNRTTATYAAPVNFGWLFVGAGHSKMAKSKRVKTGKPNILPSRFMEKAIKNTRQRVLDTYLDELQKLVNKYERKSQ
jgi:hypothetical protein